MPVQKLAATTVRAAASGVLGIAVLEGAKRVARPERVRSGAVTVTAWALRGRRKAEVGAEAARLTGADIIAEARARVGEQAPPPGLHEAGDGHDHNH